MRRQMLRGLFALGLVVAMAGPVTADQGKPAGRAGPADHDLTVTVGASRGRLGLEVLEISDELRGVLGATAGAGVLVNRVEDGSPAKAAGVRVGDVLVQVDGDAVTSAWDVLGAIGGKHKGDKVALAMVRDKQRVQLSATLARDAGPAGFGPGALGFDVDGPDGGAMKMWSRAWRGGAWGDARLEALEKRLEALERKK